jgi:hypothetical protein
MNSLTPYLPHLVIVLSLIVVVLFFMVMGASTRITKLNKLMRTFLTGPNGEDLEAMLARCLSESRGSLEKCDEIKEQLDRAVNTMRGCVQHIGLVRYDAFGDVSGSQSFSLVLLDDQRNGAIITGLLGRNDGRCYGKAVVNGQTEQTLSEEEESALHMALNGGLSATERPAERTGRQRGIINRA